MSYRIVAALALSLGLSTAAFAQTSGTDTTTGSGGETSGAATSTMTLPSGWEGAIGDAFFSDSAAGTLRSEEEIRSNWGSLSADQQAQVRTECESRMAAAGTDTQVQTGSTTTGSATTGSGAMSGGATGSAAGGDTLEASLQELCTTVQDL